VSWAGARPEPRVAGLILGVLLTLCLALLALGVGLSYGSEGLLVTVGEVTATTAVLWVRSAEAGEVVAELAAATSTEPLRATLRTSADRDHTGKTIVRELEPATRYRYRLSSGAGNVSGSFVTAPADREARPVTFLWSGDLGGGGQCRRPGTGYPIFQAMARRRPDFFLFVGDTIYADNRCRGPDVLPGAEFKASSLAEFHAKHRYNRADPAVQELFRETSVYAIWDDNEVRNNFAGPTEPLAPVGLRAFLDYWPIVPPEEERTRLYRRLRWGRLLEVFILDTRQYRSRACRHDGPEKTMLGPTQRRWLIEGLAASTAMWKVVVSSVPFSIPKAWPCGDSWAPRTLLWLRTGFAHERDAILRVAQERQINNLAVLAADVHYADLIRHQPTPGFVFHEFTAGPLAATPKNPARLDAALGAERLVAHGGVNNFGEITVDETALTVRVFDEQSQQLVAHTINAER
jgi:alkaline phosphatase D